MSYPVLRLSVLWLGVAGLAVLRGGGGGGVTGEGAELREGWVELREGWVEVRLEVRGQTEDMVDTVVLLRLVTACDSWLDIWQRDRETERQVSENYTWLKTTLVFIPSDSLKHTHRRGDVGCVSVS